MTAPAFTIVHDEPQDQCTENRQPIGQIHSWDDPDWSILDDRRGELPDFPLSALTARWQDWVRRAAHGAGVTPAHVAVPLLGIASGLIGTARRVQPSRSWSTPMTMRMGLVGSSGTGKTPGLDATKRALALIERNRKIRIAELQREHSTKVEASKAAMRLVYLVDPQTAEAFTFSTSSWGGRGAVTELGDQISRMRTVRRHATPLVELQAAEMLTRFGRSHGRCSG